MFPFSGKRAAKVVSAKNNPALIYLLSGPRKIYTVGNILQQSTAKQLNSLKKEESGETARTRWRRRKREQSTKGGFLLGG